MPVNNTFIEERIAKTIDRINTESFTIENKRNPTWEVMCQKLCAQIVESFIREGKSYHYILNALNLNNTADIENLLFSKGVQLPQARKTKESILSVFKTKLEKVDKILREKNKGVKW